MKRLALLAALALCGCDGVGDWEYQTEIPFGSTPQQLSAIEANLRSNGFVRVRMYTHREPYSGRPLSTVVYATRREVGE